VRVVRHEPAVDADELLTAVAVVADPHPEAVAPMSGDCGPYH
jgi:hypothetical protein